MRLSAPAIDAADPRPVRGAGSVWSWLAFAAALLAPLTLSADRPLSVSGAVRYSGPFEGPILVQAWEPTPGNRALKLDGHGDYVITGLTNLAGPELTIQFWFRGPCLQSAVRQQNGALDDLRAEWSGRTRIPTNAPARGWIVAGWSGFHLMSHDGLLNGIYAGMPTITNGHWHHLSITWKQGTEGGFASYLDGALLAQRDSRDRPIPNYGVPVYFGSLHGLDEYTEGILDEIAIWRRALTTEEVERDWPRKLSGTEPGLLALWRFDDGSLDDVSSSRFEGRRRGDAGVVPVEIPGLGAPVVTTRLEAPGSFQLTNLVAGRAYRLAAFLDVNGNGGWDPREPRGELATGLLTLQGDRSGVLLRLGLPIPFWRSWWFIVLAVAGVTGLGAAFIRAHERSRLQRRLAELEQRHVLERERARIAQDLHDELGASLTHIGLLGALAGDAATAPAEARFHLQEIRHKARELVRSLDAIVWALNPACDSTAQLVSYVCQAAEELYRASPTRLRLNMPEVTPDLPLTAQVRHDLFLAVREALHNILKHAHAREAWLSLAFRDSQLQVCIEDNGGGCPPPADQAQRISHGLSGMQTRLARWGGTCRIEPRPGGGTRVLLNLPLPATRTTAPLPPTPAVPSA